MSIYLGIFTFSLRAQENNKKWINEELISDEFILGDEKNKNKDPLYISRALRTRGITRNDNKTLFDKWTGNRDPKKYLYLDVKVSCKLIREIKGLSKI